MEKQTRKKILVIEDESHIAEGLKLNLALQGYDVDVAGDGGTGLDKWRTWHPDLIVLDIMLPVIDGLSVLQNIRLTDERIPILILSARNEANDKVKGLSYGVDDYMAKPFNLEELLLRVERLLTRSSWYDNEEKVPDEEDLSGPYTFGGNSIDFSTFTAQCAAGAIQLTEQEARLLKLFICNPGKPLTRKKLLEIGWGYTAKTSTRTVDNFIVRFRKYFEKNPKKPIHFKSLRSVGYIFSAGTRK